MLRDSSHQRVIGLPLPEQQVLATQEIGRLHARSLDGPGADAEADPVEWPADLIDRAINGVELPDYADVPDHR